MKQEFAFSVLNETLLTDYGKTLVRNNMHSFDAQKVYRKLVEYHESSTKARFPANQLLQYITTARYTTAWNGTAQNFLLHWKNQLRLYDDLVPATDRLSQASRAQLLVNAVNDIEELRQVKTNEEMNMVMNGQQPLTYEQYFDLLYVAATRYDSKFFPTSV